MRPLQLSSVLKAHMNLGTPSCKQISGTWTVTASQDQEHQIQVVIKIIYMLLASQLKQAHQVPSMDFNLLQNYSGTGAHLFQRHPS